MLVSAHAFALKYRSVYGQLLVRRFNYASTGAVSKPTVTRKKYSELPSLPTQHAPSGAFIAGASIASYQLIPPDPPLEPIVSESHLTHSSRKRRTRRVRDSTPNAQDASSDSCLPKVKAGRQAKSLASNDGPPALRPRNQLATEILENLAKFPHCILLTRVGQFYESYFDQAAEVARLLNIKLTSRKWDNQTVLMCGFPLVHLQKHLNTLVQQSNRFVALCEEFARSVPPGTKPLFDRRVVRIVTPGTLIDEPFLNHYENNYLLAISSDASRSLEGHDDVGLAWIDVSTGEFFTKCTTMEYLYDDVTRIRPREVVLTKSMESIDSCPVQAIVRRECPVVSYSDTVTPTHPQPLVQSVLASDSISVHAEPPTTPTLSSPETSAVNLLTSYLQLNLLEFMPDLSAPNKEVAEARMEIDAYTLKSLEIQEGIQEGGATGTLLGCVKKTVTGGGTRLLARWLCSPSTSLSEINARQSLVAFFHARPHLRRDFRERLRGIDDVTRTVQKFLLGRGSPNDIAAISTAISTWSFIKGRILLERELQLREQDSHLFPEWASVDALTSRMEELPELVRKIQTALDSTTTQGPSETFEEGAILSPDQSSDEKWQQGYRWFINPEFSEELSALHTRFQRLLKQREDLESDLQRHYNAPSLTLRSSPLQGLHVHIAKSKRDAAKAKASPDFTVIAESNSTCCLFNQGWAQVGSELLETSQSIASAEKAAFEALRNEVKMHETQLRRTARVIDELDVTLGFASLASDMHFTRPNMTDDCSFHVVNGRHPTVEIGLLSSGRMFTPNTVSLSPDSQLHVVTGPNMAGKSTLLRQTALIAILAQSGSFVPADYAQVGIVDRLFSRIGAKDDLFRDRSTFMVEMQETADILKKATPRSLVIMDEVGRGTSVRDGLAIAFAVVHHLYFKNDCRALFATHFHELSDMFGCTLDYRGANPFGRIGFFCTDVQETESGSFTYSHRLRPGVNKESHGLKVAQLAGMPPSTVAVARELMARLKSDDVWIPPFREDTLKALGQSLTPDATSSEL
ncbi:muts domain V-domain-containing protein [Lactarius psammicola]|nr:muts domain V-domain-containing protein [Lactarius psammicola]